MNVTSRSQSYTDFWSWTWNNWNSHYEKKKKRRKEREKKRKEKQTNSEMIESTFQTETDQKNQRGKKLLSNPHKMLWRWLGCGTRCLINKKDINFWNCFLNVRWMYMSLHIVPSGKWQMSPFILFLKKIYIIFQRCWYILYTHMYICRNAP